MNFIAKYFNQVLSLLLEQTENEDTIKHYVSLTPTQVKAISIETNRAWLLQGGELVKNKLLTPSLFLKISSHLLGLSTEETLHIFNLVHIRLYVSMNNDMNKWENSFFAMPKTIKDKKEEIKSRCESRMTIF